MTGTTINTPIVIECYDRHPRESQKLTFAIEPLLNILFGNRKCPQIWPNRSSRIEVERVV